VALRSSPYGIAIDRRRERIWVTLTGTNRVVKLWTNGPRTVANVASVRQPDTIAVDDATGRAFVTGKVDSVLQLLDPADRRPRARTP
jgi:DNA-binding beta-propeller fold protein YncE